MSSWRSELICTAFNEGQLPPPAGPEVAIAGRSNVGKSTLINALFNRTSKKIAHVSSSPGKTRSLNFYRVTPADGAPFALVDLPGYGYAARSRGERESWRRLIGAYFRSRAECGRLAFVMHLMDIRHGPLAADDELIEWLDGLDLPRLAIFTKGDKLSRSQAKSALDKYIAAGLVSLAPPEVTCGKNDAAAERLRVITEQAIGELGVEIL